MALNILLGLGMYPVLFILYFVLKGEAHEKPGLCFGVHIPGEEEGREEFLRLAKEQELLYQKRMKRYMLLLALIPWATFFIPYVSICMTIWMCWLLAAIAFMMLPMVLGNRVMARWKKENAVREKYHVVYTEIKAAGEIRRVRFVEFAPWIFLSLAAGIVFSIYFRGAMVAAMAILVDIFAVTTLLLYLMALWMDHQRVLVISMDSEVNLNFARARKSCWKNFWLACCIVNTGFTSLLAVWLAVKGLSFWGIMLFSVLYTIVLSGLVVWTAKKLKRLGESYASREEAAISEAESDEHWIWGMFYYNKNDRHSMVETRYGIGTTMNMARPAGKLINLIGAAALLSIPIMCVWLIRLEFTPIRLSLEGQQLVASQLVEDYRIPVGQMEGLELVEELPELSKINGTGMDNLYKGKFHIVYAGDCEVFLNPQNHLFLRFTADGTLYYMSAAEDGATRELYEQLRQEKGIK